MLRYTYIAGAVLLTTYGQMILKWQLSKAGVLPDPLLARLWFLLSQLRSPWILSGLAAAGVAALCWMAALTQFQLSHAYPFMSLSFVLVLVLSAVFFGEAATAPRVIGIILILAGALVGSRG